MCNASRIDVGQNSDQIKEDLVGYGGWIARRWFGCFEPSLIEKKLPVEACVSYGRPGMMNLHQTYMCNVFHMKIV